MYVLVAIQEKISPKMYTVMFFFPSFLRGGIKYDPTRRGILALLKDIWV